MLLKKILIADDHAILRNSVLLLLKNHFPDTEFIEAVNGKEAVDLYNVHKPDVMLVDYNMPILNGYEVAELLLKKNKNIKIIMLTMFDTLPVVLNFLKIGGKGFLSKNCLIEEIGESVMTVSKGNYYFCTEFEREAFRWIKNRFIVKVPKIRFTPLELSLLFKMSRGKTSKEISGELNLSFRTVETYRYDLIKKAKVNNTAELIDYLHKNGVLN